MSSNDNQPSRFLDNSLNPKTQASGLRSRLGTIEARIAALEAEMSLLKRERDEVLRDLAGIIYPVLTLPTDVTSEIFLQYMQNPVQSWYQRPSPLRLASVCRLWRAVALSTSRLWTQLSFGSTLMYPPSVERAVSYTSGAVADRLQYWLPRAGGLAVDLRIKLPQSPTQESDAILRTLAQYSSRWGSLRLMSDGPICFPVDMGGSFCALREISLASHPSWDGTSRIFAFGDAPNLREVSLSGVELEDWDMSLPWSQVKTLHLSSTMAVDENFKILERSPNIEDLTVSYWDDQGHPTSPLILHHLHTIHVGSESSEELLEHLILPSLAHVHVDWLTSECAARLGSLIIRSGCSPQTLSLLMWRPQLEPILAAISAVPSVRELQLTWLGGSTEGFKDLFEALAEQSSLLPALESFSIENCQTGIDLLSLAQMLGARRMGRDGVAKLKSFGLSFSQEDKYEDAVDFVQQDKEVEVALEQLGSFRSQGLQLDIQSSIKWFSTSIDPQMIAAIGADESG